MKKALLPAIIFISFLLRFYYLGIIPPAANLSIYGARMISTLQNIWTLIILYYLTRRFTKNELVSLLSCLIFGTLPWTIEQSRIVSEVNSFLFWLMTLITITIFSRGKIVKVVTIAFIPLFLYLTYPSFWLFKINSFAFNLESFFKNIFLLTSFDLLFFRNITFWWGGIREWGALHISYLPFLLVGIFQLIVKRIIYLIIPIVPILIISALSPFLPESREFYLITPFISVLLAIGIFYFFSFFSKEKYRYLAIIIFFLIFIYDFSNFLHYYIVHYPQQIMGNMQNIHGVF